MISWGPGTVGFLSKPYFSAECNISTHGSFPTFQFCFGRVFSNVNDDHTSGDHGHYLFHEVNWTVFSTHNKPRWPEENLFYRPGGERFCIPSPSPQPTLLLYWVYIQTEGWRWTLLHPIPSSLIQVVPIKHQFNDWNILDARLSGILISMFLPFSKLLWTASAGQCDVQALSSGRPTPLQCFFGLPLSSLYYNHHPFSTYNILVKLRKFMQSNIIKIITLFLQINMV